MTSAALKITFAGQTRKFNTAPLSDLLQLVASRFAAPSAVVLVTEMGEQVDSDATLERVASEGAKLKAVLAPTTTLTTTAPTTIADESPAVARSISASDAGWIMPDSELENPFADAVSPGGSSSDQGYGEIKYPEVPPIPELDEPQPVQPPSPGIPASESNARPATAHVTETELAAAMEEEFVAPASKNIGAFPEDEPAIIDATAASSAAPASEATAAAQPATASSSQRATPNRPQPILPLLRGLLARIKQIWDSDPELRSLSQQLAQAMGANAAGVVRSVGVAASNGGQSLGSLVQRLRTTVEEWAAEVDRARAASAASEPRTTASSSSSSSEPRRPVSPPTTPSAASNAAASALSVAFVVSQQISRIIADVTQRWASASASRPNFNVPVPDRVPGAFPDGEHHPPPPPQAPRIPAPPFPPRPPQPFGIPPPPPQAFPTPPLSVLHANDIAAIREMGLAQGITDEEVAGMVNELGVDGAVGRLLG